MLSHENHDNLHDKYLPSTKMTLNIIKKHDLGKKIINAPYILNDIIKTLTPAIYIQTCTYYTF